MLLKLVAERCQPITWLFLANDEHVVAVDEKLVTGLTEREAFFFGLPNVLGKNS